MSRPLHESEAVGFTVSVAATHPSFAGHFPGAPAAPGVLLLDLVASGLRKQSGIAGPLRRIAAVKFHEVVHPGWELAVVARIERNSSATTVRFTASHDDRLVVEGALHFGASP